MHSKLPGYCHEIRRPKLAAVREAPALWGAGFAAWLQGTSAKGADRRWAWVLWKRTPFK